MRLESGPARADRNWRLIQAVLFLGFATYFFFDWAVGYPNKNKEVANEKLANRELFGGQLTYDKLADTPDEAALKRLKEANPTTREQVQKILGTPQYTRRESAGRSTEVYISKWGYAEVPLQGDRLSEQGQVTWTKWARSKEEIWLQLACGLIALVPGLYFARRLYKAITLHVTIDDEGMVYDHRRIAFADMVSLRDYSPKGWIDLYHKVGEGEKRLRLDNEKVKKFDEIVSAICKAKGFKNEVKEYGAKKAREEAQEEAAEEAAQEAKSDKSDDTRS